MLEFTHEPIIGRETLRVYPCRYEDGLNRWFKKPDVATSGNSSNAGPRPVRVAFSRLALQAFFPYRLSSGQEPGVALQLVDRTGGLGLVFSSRGGMLVDRCTASF